MHKRQIFSKNYKQLTSPSIFWTHLVDYLRPLLRMCTLYLNAPTFAYNQKMRDTHQSRSQTRKPKKSNHIFKNSKKFFQKPVTSKTDLNTVATRKRWRNVEGSFKKFENWFESKKWREKNNGRRSTLIATVYNSEKNDRFRKINQFLFNVFRIFQ